MFSQCDVMSFRVRPKGEYRESAEGNCGVYPEQVEGFLAMTVHKLQPGG